VTYGSIICLLACVIFELSYLVNKWLVVIIALGRGLFTWSAWTWWNHQTTRI